MKTYREHRHLIYRLKNQLRMKVKEELIIRSVEVYKLQNVEALQKVTWQFVVNEEHNQVYSIPASE